MNLSKRDDTKELQILGKTLFFDPILSANNKRACASCHDPKKAFTDGKAKSISFNFEGTVERNSPTLMNSVYSDRFFYDLRAQKLEDQVDHVITSSKEFDTDYTKIIDKLSSNSEYVAMFRKAYPHINSSKIVNKYTITTALAAYVGNLVSFDSDFDKYIRKEISEIDSSVIRGYNLFAGKALCGTCHFTPTFNGTVPPFFIETDSENLGVTVSSNLKQPVLDTDLGRAKGLLKDRLEIFNHSFKTLTIRNIELTAPYMHNGAFKTLEEVLEFYNEGGGMGLGLDNPYQTLPDDKLNLTKQEKADIIAFMKSLTDNPKVEVPTLPKYQNIDRVAGGEY
jgi:cytochrome c peroxidase